MRKFFVYILHVVIGLHVTLIVPVNIWSQDFESYYLYLGDYPREANTGWHEEAQGVTHDDDNWFITQDVALWKIPVTHNLWSVSPIDPGVLKKTFADYPNLTNAGYGGFGDLDYYKYNGIGYLAIGLSSATLPPAVGIFKASDLSYVAHAQLTTHKTVKWCAIHPGGLLYTSDEHASAFKKYDLGWNHIAKKGTIQLTFLGDRPFFDFNGSTLLLRYVQGGVFSPSGELFYVVSGWWKDTDEHAEGIHVFDTQSWRRIQHSTNGYGYFNYEFDSGYWPDASEEPEGLTIWDLDNGKAPGISGQLHVLMLDNDASDDDIYFKHYTGTIYVNEAYTGTEQGTPSQPFNTVTEAYNLAWNGAKFEIKAGTYPEAITFNNKLLLISSGGIVTIGK
jgi:hypothetical protein